MLTALILLAMGIDEAYADHTNEMILEDFVSLIESAESVILPIYGQFENIRDTSDSMDRERIVSNYVFLNTFEDVIRSQLFWVGWILCHG